MEVIKYCYDNIYLINGKNIFEDYLVLKSNNNSKIQYYEKYFNSFSY